VLNNREPAVWGQIALLCVAQERLPEAEQALHHALKLDLTDDKVLVEVGEAFAGLSSWAIAEKCARRAIVLRGAPPAHKLLGDVLVEQRAYEEAALAYQEALALVEGDAVLTTMYKKLLRTVYGDYLGKPQEAAKFR
jgi:tetratricopeptide (TPR) repeat protein